MASITAQDVEVAMANGPLEVRIADAGEMAFIRAKLPNGTDYSQPLRAISPNHCGVPHWIYAISGELQIPHTMGVWMWRRRVSSCTPSLITPLVAASIRSSWKSRHVNQFASSSPRWREDRSSVL